MKVILIQKVDKLGMPGDVKNVSDGYAANFLFPKKLAQAATAQSIKEAENQKKRQSKVKASTFSQLHQNVNKLKNKTLKITAKTSDKGHLFAAVSVENIANEIDKQFKIKLSPKDIKILRQIKEVGDYKITYSPAKDATAEFTVSIKSSG